MTYTTPAKKENNYFDHKRLIAILPRLNNKLKTPKIKANVSPKKKPINP